MVIINKIEEPKPYREDLRERILKVVNESKMSIKNISEVLNIEEND